MCYYNYVLISRHGVGVATTTVLLTVAYCPPLLGEHLLVRILPNSRLKTICEGVDRHTDPVRIAGLAAGRGPSPGDCQAKCRTE